MNKYLFLLIILAISLLLWYFLSPTYKEIESFTSSAPYPAIKRYDNFLSKEECQQIIKLAKPRLQRSTLGPSHGIGKERTSYQTWLKTNELPCLTRCSKTVAEISKTPPENQEDWQVLRYEPGQQYTPHYDACSETASDYKECIEDTQKRGWGKRMYTFFIYLNDVDEGGETYFPKLNVSFKPKQGTAIFWHNLTDDKSKAHPYSEHAGMPVIKGVKWGINVWVREHPENSN